MNTLCIDLLTLLDNYLDAKDSALLCACFKEFTDGYDLFDISQMKWLLYTLYKYGAVEVKVRKQLNYKTTHFILNHGCLKNSMLQQHEFDIKFIKESKMGDIIKKYTPERYNSYGVYELEYIINACIKLDYIEVVKGLVTVLMKKYSRYELFNDSPHNEVHIIVKFLANAHIYIGVLNVLNSLKNYIPN